MFANTTHDVKTEVQKYIQTRIPIYSCALYTDILHSGIKMLGRPKRGQDFSLSYKTTKVCLRWISLAGLLEVSGGKVWLKYFSSDSVHFLFI